MSAPLDVPLAPGAIPADNLSVAMAKAANRGAHLRSILLGWRERDLFARLANACWDKKSLIAALIDAEAFSETEVDQLIVADNLAKGLPADEPFRLCGGAQTPEVERSLYEAARTGATE